MQSYRSIRTGIYIGNAVSFMNHRLNGGLHEDNRSVVDAFRMMNRSLVVFYSPVDLKKNPVPSEIKKLFAS
jgi:hypothetical protein